MRKRGTILYFFFIMGFAIFVNIASAGINIIDADATYEANLSGLCVPTDSYPVETMFTWNIEAISKHGLSRVSIPTEPSSIKEMFIHLEEAKTYEDLTFPNELIGDITLPIIADVSITCITGNSATIKWDTNEITDSLVKYGKVSGIYTKNKEDSLFVTNHTILLTGLQSSTTYYFVVCSADQSENSAQCAEYNFITVGGTNGDLNSNSENTPADTTIALQLAFSSEYDSATDDNGDDRATSFDALMIPQVGAGAYPFSIILYPRTKVESKRNGCLGIYSECGKVGA